MKRNLLIAIVALIIGLQFLFSCSDGLSIKTMQYASNGQKLYGVHCQNCHGEKGEGLAALYPPLTDASFLNENRSKLACMIRYGMEGEIEVDERIFNEKMPANASINSLDMAYILTYISTYFGDSKTHFTKEEVESFLENCQ